MEFRWVVLSKELRTVPRTHSELYVSLVAVMLPLLLLSQAPTLALGLEMQTQQGKSPPSMGFYSSEAEEGGWGTGALSGRNWPQPRVPISLETGLNVRPRTWPDQDRQGLLQAACRPSPPPLWKISHWTKDFQQSIDTQRFSPCHVLSFSFKMFLSSDSIELIVFMLKPN